MILFRARPSLVVALAVAAIAAVATGCGHHVPALFADRPVVTTVRDDKPIDLPSRRDFDEREQISDIYFRRPLFDVVRPLDFPTAGDVNAMDEVPASTWYDPEQPLLAASDASPVLPFTALDERPAIADEALVVRDARGRRFELLADPPEQTGLFTAAEVLGGALLRGLGLRAPRAWILALPDSSVTSDGEKGNARLDAWLAKKAATTEGGRRVSATAGTDGIDVGVTSDYSVRRDDPNDRVDHHNRRTLRATKIFAHWMGWSEFGVRSTRDAYVGKVGEGHLLHYVIGTSRALGTLDLRPTETRDEESGGVVWNLVTLGLSAPTVRAAQRSPISSLGYLPADLVPGDFDVSPPYSAFVRLTPPDEYWAAKRMMDATDAALRAGLAAAFLQPEAARHLTEVLVARRQLLVAHAMTVVSAVDPAATVGRSVWLRDRGIAAGVAEASDTTYDVAFLDSDGADLAPPVHIRAAGGLTAVVLPKKLLFGVVVLHVRVIRSGIEAPRPCDLHLKADRSSVRVFGVRH
jgi:hypothetical protein